MARYLAYFFILAHLFEFELITQIAIKSWVGEEEPPEEKGGELPDGIGTWAASVIEPLHEVQGRLNFPEDSLIV